MRRVGLLLLSLSACLPACAERRARLGAGREAPTVVEAPPAHRPSSPSPRPAPVPSSAPRNLRVEYFQIGEG